MIGLQLKPLDTLFFGDGTPFSAGSAFQHDVGGLFPPHPGTVAGAIRAALARCNGWNGQGRWPQGLDEVLGNGPNNPGTLSLTGPVLLHKDEPLFPIPSHVLGSIERGVWVPRAILRPGRAVHCDLGEAVRLPEPTPIGVSLQELKPGAGLWFTKAGLQAVLQGVLPAKDQIKPASKLWSEERRIGLKRNQKTRTAEEGMLYSSRHVRMHRCVTLGVTVDGVPEHWTLPLGQILPLGGESRVVECCGWDADLELDMPITTIAATRRLMLIAITPLDLHEAVCRGKQPLAEFGGARVVSACLARPLRVGGWDSLANRPLPLHSVLPPGSVLFCEVDDPQLFQAALSQVHGLPRIGKQTKWGFGVVALGTWYDQSGVA